MPNRRRPIFKKSPAVTFPPRHSFVTVAPFFTPLRRWTARAPGSTLTTGGYAATSKVTFGPNITDARNKIGTVVYFRNHFGAAVRGWVEPAQPGTDRQLDCQAAMSAAMLRWQTTLTDKQRTAWQHFSQRYPNNTSINGRKPLAGVGKYVQLNLFSFLYGGVHIDDPPADQDVTAPLNLALLTNNATGYAVDKFDRADSDDLGVDWEVNPPAYFQIFSHQIAPKSPDYWSLAAWITPAFGSDQIARATLKTAPSDTFRIGPAVRVNPTPRTAYILLFLTDACKIYKIVTGNITLLAGSPNPPIPGATYEIEVVGTTLTARENGATIIGPLDDTDIATGQPGLAAVNDSTTVRLDNWLGKNYGADDPLTISLATPGDTGEVLVVRATRPLSAGILNFNAWLKIIGFYTAPLTYPLDIFWDWKNTYDLIMIPPPAPPAPPATPAGTLVAGKRIGINAYFVRLANGAPSQPLSAHSLAT